MTTRRILRLNPADNVVVAIADLPAGSTIESGILARARVPRGHKIAARPIAPGEPIRKFGQIIGFASTAIEPGEWVHEKNVTMGEDFERDYAFAADATAVEGLRDGEVPAFFEGFRRADGRAGTRNYIGILSSVNCSATVVDYVADEIMRSGILADYPDIDGIVPLPHGQGCGMAGKGEAFDILARTQWGYASHPNFSAVLLVGLGCEVFQIPRMKEMYRIAEGDHFQSLTIQETGGTRKAVEAGVARVREMLPFAARNKRQPIAASELSLALQCGGSDGYSGLTANPALGVAADMLVRQGGTAILSETPEIYGAEHLLTRRAESAEVGQKIVDLIAWWEAYTARNGGEMNNNPSPGNKAGGLTTILEKSLGAVAKGGNSTLRGVYRYAEKIDRKGFVYMDTPGYDPVAATGQVAGGANILCFTTGRGSAYGCKPVPSIKLATNSELFARMPEDMDINCGDIVEGVTLEEKGRQIFAEILAVASGKPTKSETLGYGRNEFVPWQIGAVM
ncbi:UxaA family hydrolase [Rhizobium sp. SSA_523]|uniref:UxaA family hydrolase n=1 Tax=Rhizobium sp. SSA_523 TaxID=2952477 RepID=UPI002090BDE4|nr:altronate dehydratase family protein [Rhizobium sp. SSA_523]MCO5732146.1 altronate dehydratase family protein [Rhizobium sp. SSA_523]WKC21439.1 altronate dehydratase family protein [Rhizobium sp. SSA_523]